MSNSRDYDLIDKLVWAARNSKISAENLHPALLQVQNAELRKRIADTATERDQAITDKVIAQEEYRKEQEKKETVLVNAKKIVGKHEEQAKEAFSKLKVWYNSSIKQIKADYEEELQRVHQAHQDELTEKLSVQKTEFDTECSKLQSKLTHRKNQISVMVTERNNLKAELKQAQDKSTQAQAELTRLRIELEQAQMRVSELSDKVVELTSASARAEMEHFEKVTALSDKHERFKTKYKSRCRAVYNRKVSEYKRFVDDAADMSLKYLDSLEEQEQGKEALEKAKAELDRTKPKADAYDKIKKARADRKGKGYNTVCRKQIAAIVLLKVFNKLSDTEIGKVLGMSRNTVAKYRKEAKAICEEYTGVEGGVFTKQVAKKFELPEGTIRSILDTYGIRYQKKDGRILSDKKKPRGQLQKLGVKSTHLKRTKNAQNF